MNVYLLVEGGRTEKKLYPSWLSHRLPDLTRISSPADACGSHYYLVSGGGQPSILHDHLPNAIADVERYGTFDLLVVVLDAEESTVAVRLSEVKDAVEAAPTPLRSAKLRVIVQNRCIETWLLGNRRMLRRNPHDTELREYIDFYNVSEDDPELLLRRSGFTTCAQFHHVYLRAMFRERGLTYTKRDPGEARGEPYLRELEDRSASGHLASFGAFQRLVEEIREDCP